MFNYTKEVIINDASGVTFANGEIRIPRAANYKAVKILDKKIYKTAPVVGSAGKVKITLPTGITKGDIIRITMFLSTPGVELAEFGTPCWQDFGKPLVIEVSAKADAARVAAAIKLAAGEYVTATVDSGAVVVEGKEKWMDFQDVDVKVIELLENDEVAGVVTTDAKVDLTAAVAEFGTAEWIDHTLRFPTAPNRRYSPLFADELPVRGGKYYQYVFKYIARHNVPGGLSGVDQCVDSITAHIFFVKDDQVTAFDKVLTQAGITPTLIADYKANLEELSMNPYANEVADVAGQADANKAAVTAAKSAADAATAAAKKANDKLAAIGALTGDAATVANIIAKAKA